MVFPAFLKFAAEIESCPGDFLLLRPLMAWKRIVWEKVWAMKDSDVELMYKQPDILPIMFDIIEKNYYIVWWIISDNCKGLTRMCQKMAAMLCGCSALKGHDLKLKQASHWSKCCVRCDLL